MLNPKDKRKARRNEDLINYTIQHIQDQKCKEIFYRRKPNQVLIHDKDGYYKTVSKEYATYYMTNDEYETETELENETDILERKTIIQKYK